MNIYEKKNSTPIKLYCFKVNPELLASSSLDAKKAFDKIPIRKIPNLKSYYNLNNNNADGDLMTSIFANSGKNFKLFLQGSYSVENPNYSYKGPQKVTNKFLNIQKNLGNKEIFIKALTKKRGPDADLIFNISQNRPNIEMVIDNLSEIQVIQNDLPIPKSCIYKCEECNADCNFGINQIGNQSQNAIQTELGN